MDVPVGWQVQGGMHRFGNFDVRWMMDVRSLHSKIIVRIFDVNVPQYTLPGPHTGREGQAYSRPLLILGLLTGKVDLKSASARGLHRRAIPTSCYG